MNNDSIAVLFRWVLNHKYLFVTIAFVAIMVFFDKHNLIEHFKNQREIVSLKAENRELKEQLDELRYRSDELHKDVAIMEKVAREKYGMHKEGEEVFIVKD
ncbi:MAG: septum formation initiator family protein [Bacteroidaceae bacterium]|nr:septum formation initiator family protein [Bacteroidaceae bacterium]MBQ8257728.1 septum formation initiator family protein [Bacteroidaceae bacterium]